MSQKRFASGLALTILLSANLQGQATPAQREQVRAYRKMGGLQTDPQMAWLNYRNAYTILSQYPRDEQARGEMQSVRRSIEAIEARLPELPKLDWTSLDSAQQKDFDAVMARYISVSAAATSAEVTAETMRRSMADQGLAVRPETVGGLIRMKLKLEDARRLIEQRNFQGAKERLDSAGSEAQRILKSLGG